MRSPPNSNALCCVQKLTQGIASRLSDDELKHYAYAFQEALEALMWHDSLPKSDLFDMAQKDFASSTDDLIARRFGQSRWASQQAMEKTIKGLLTLGGTPFPTSGGGGHNLPSLSRLLATSHDIHIPEPALMSGHCPAAVRYGEHPSTEDQALAANTAVITALQSMRKSPGTAKLTS